MKVYSGLQVWFTSDTHYWHKNIIKYCERPFRDVHDMNAEMVRRWREVVAPEDLVFHLGDFSFGGLEKAMTVGLQLPGRKILVRGNHDTKRDRWGFTDTEFVNTMGFEQVVGIDGLTLEMPQGLFYLAHHPHPNRLAWPEAAKVDGCSIQLCGHVHDAWKYAGAACNVGVDQWDFTPVSIEEILRGHH
jgi:calcineurin-like phosphoesterase family protein